MRSRLQLYDKNVYLLIDVFVVYRTIPTSNHNLFVRCRLSRPVVYRTIPTSNHNYRWKGLRWYWLYIVLFLHQTTTCQQLALLAEKLYIVLFLHQTTTYSYWFSAWYLLYIVLFLHQTTTYWWFFYKFFSCISYYSYIKPQRFQLVRF